ncbi:hypothetical protein HBH51_015450 [Parastagonospora nodorum]|nr:hypothetical protein HBH51_015450 [Parastagonospora nodorum]KAH5252561.1 hypothetical protein HBI71_149670 [Parastagonospora nodorum]KAH5396719.1 hypothetical protein HBI32_199620 [Parastagonospora nodorum]
MSKEKSVESVKLEEGVLSTPPHSRDELATPDSESRYITGLKLYLINAGLIVSMFLVQMDSSIISTAVVNISDDLGGYEKSSWLFTGYLITYCSTSMILAKISDIYGRKLVLIVCLGIFTIFSALCGAAQTMIQLIMFRWCQGVGGGGVFALVQLMFLELVPRRKLPAYMSMVTSALALSLVIGPLLGGGITQHGSWRWIFIVNVPVGVLAGLALFFTLPKTAWNEPAADPIQDRSLSASLSRLDFLGAFLMLGAIVLLTTGLQQTAQGYAWESPMVLGLVISFIPMAIAFFMWQWWVTTRRTSPEPVFPWRLIQDRRRLGMIVNTFLAGTVQFVCIAQIPQRFVTVNDVSPLSAALRLLAFGAMIPVGSALAGALMGKPRIPPCGVVLAGAVLEIIGVVLLSRISTSPQIDSTQYGFQVLAGLGTGMVNAALIILVPYIMETKDLSVGSAACTQFRILGGLVGLAILVSISTPYIRQHLTDIVSPEIAMMLLEKTEIIKELPLDTADKVRTLFGKGYNLQITILIGFAAAKIPVTALMWTNQKSDV